MLTELYTVHIGMYFLHVKNNQKVVYSATLLICFQETFPTLHIESGF